MFRAKKMLRTALLAASVTPFVLPQALSAAPQSASGARPNILLVLVDDMGWGDLNCNWAYGEKFKNRNRTHRFKTPTLDKMASEGILLSRHYTACPVSAPARASLMTGMHQGHTRQVRDNTFDTPIADVHTLGSVLKEAGYATAAIGKWGIGGVGNGSTGNSGYARARERGFDYFYGLFDHLAGHYHYPANSGRYVWENETDVTEKLKGGYAYSTDLFTARAKDWIVKSKKADPNRPFFVYLALPAPHGSLRVPNCPYPAGGGLKGGVQWTKDGTVNTANPKLGQADSYIHPDNKNFTTDAARRHSTMIRRVDDAMADLFKLLKDLKIDDNTLVVFTADNGPHEEAGNDCGKTAFYASGSPAQDPSFFKSYGMMDGIKRDVFEGGLRVPAIVRWPKFIPKKKTTTEPSQFHDWLATFADVAGAEVPSSSDGVSLLPILTGEGKRIPGQIYCEYSVGGSSSRRGDFAPAHHGLPRRNQLVVWENGYKGLARNLNEHSKFSGDGAVVFEIYDTLKDPQETKNLAGKPGFGEDFQQKLRDKALRSRRAFDGKHPHEYTRGLDFSQKSFFEKNPVPAVAQAGNTENMDFEYKVFASQKAFPWVPDFRQTRREAVLSGKAQKALGENLLPQEFVNRRGARGILIEGTVSVPENAEYVFTLQTDNAKGSKAFVHLYDIQLIDADKLYKPGTAARSYANVGTENPTGTRGIRLAAGTHKIRIEYVCSAAAQAPSLVLTREKR
ncbi:MAG: sulfatase-like hydrolase/transferase [Opitutales bacterium]|nr:sulfatase-like hydrolase/transferase [Opitutales bacterium]